MESFFEITVERTGDTVLITPVGEIDIAAKADLDAVLASLPDGCAVVVDMSAVSFMELTGLRFLLDLHRLAARHGSVLVTAGWRGQPVRLLTRVAEVRGSAAPLVASAGEVRRRLGARAVLARFLAAPAPLSPPAPPEPASLPSAGRPDVAGRSGA